MNGSERGEAAVFKSRGRRAASWTNVRVCVHALEMGTGMQTHFGMTDVILDLGEDTELPWKRELGGKSFTPTQQQH